MVLLLYFPTKDSSPNYVSPYLHPILEILLQKKITRRSDPPAGDKNKDYVSTLLVVAALVATVTLLQELPPLEEC